MAPMMADWPGEDGRKHVGAETATLPRPWGAILGAVGVLQYVVLSALGVYGAMTWQARAGVPGVDFPRVGLVGAAAIVLFGLLCAYTKARGWWQAEWVLLWFLMAALVVHAVVEAMGDGWPEWVMAESFFLLACTARCLSLYLFARKARWGAERRHLIRRPLTPEAGTA